jgi:WLM domain
MGQKILLRLRPAWAPDTFYPEEDIIHTMLHEVVFLPICCLLLLLLSYPLSSAHT